VESQHTGGLVSSSIPRLSPTAFTAYDNARFVVLLGNSANTRPVYGIARFQRDDKLGGILRISLDGAGPGSPAIIVSEEEWGGLITRDFRHGADYCLILTSDWQTRKERQS
jgi:hypothetical protein